MRGWQKWVYITVTCQWISTCSASMVLIQIMLSKEGTKFCFKTLIQYLLYIYISWRLSSIGKQLWIIDNLTLIYIYSEGCRPRWHAPTPPLITESWSWELLIFFFFLLPKNETILSYFFSPSKIEGFFFATEKWDDFMLTQQLLINFTPPRIIQKFKNVCFYVNKLRKYHTIASDCFKTHSYLCKSTLTPKRRL